MTIIRTLAATLAAMAIAASAAHAAPADMHASTAEAAAQEQQKQDLRGEQAKDAAANAAAAQAQQKQDLRGEHAKDAAAHPRKSQGVGAPGATAVDSQSKSTPVDPGQPTWAMNPKPLPPPTQHASTTSSDDGVDWATVGIGVGITLLVLGGIVALTNRSRQLPRTRISA
jgi:hypothetical protein